mmetsp:Transcript_22826/g.54653  ORF Transcript_22826/g.54653 Transcript_22826/m.54653 type:complete len:123 (-) Transcript_22826:188-556(-)
MNLIPHKLSLYFGAVRQGRQQFCTQMSAAFQHVSALEAYIINESLENPFHSTGKTLEISWLVCIYPFLLNTTHDTSKESAPVRDTRKVGFTETGHNTLRLALRHALQAGKHVLIKLTPANLP